MFEKGSQALCLAILAVGAAHAVAREMKGEVTLTVNADRKQPAGWPVVVELTVRNTGKEPVSWWCGGPGIYPGAEHFAVRVRYGRETVWQDATGSNGQYTEGSGRARQLASGESIVVPLAVPVRKLESSSLGVTVSILPRDWHAAEPVECFVSVIEDAQRAEQMRVSVIQAVLNRNAFWMHVAERYPDPVVMDAMLKLVTLDCAPIVSISAHVLARQATLPEEAGKDFAAVVKRWLPQKARPEWGGLQDDVTRAALATKSEAARRAVLELLQSAPDAQARSILISALRVSAAGLSGHVPPCCIFNSNRRTIRNSHARSNGASNGLTRD